MPVMAPPPIKPLQESVERIRANPAVLKLISRMGLRDLEFRISGAAILDEKHAAKAITRAKTLSDAIYNLAEASVDAGYPVAQVLYARSADVVYVHIELHSIDSIRGPEHLIGFFRGLEHQLVTEDRFERRRILASRYSDRVGLTVQPKIIKEGDAYVLDFPSAETDGYSPLLDVSFSNPGNRFVGRYFANADFHYDNQSGDEFRIGWTHGLTGLDSHKTSDGYDQESLAWSRVTPYGLFGVAGSNTDYRQRENEPGLLQSRMRRYAGDNQHIETSALVPILATSDWRWLAGGGIDYTNRRFEDRSDSTPLQDQETSLKDQEYASLQLSSLYILQFELDHRPLDINIGATFRMGLGKDRRGNEETAADLGYTLLRPELRLRWDATPALRASLTATGQFSGSVTPTEEQWVLGGLQYSQAWLPGVAVGDGGALAHLELEYRKASVGPVKLSPSVFADYGFADYHEAINGTDRQTLSDIGIGVEAKMKRLKANVSYALPLHDQGIDQAVLDESRARVMFALKASF